MKLEEGIKLDFNDVLFRPKRSTLSSRNEVDIEREYTFKFSKRKWKGVPIISSNMDTVSSIDMFKKLSQYKMLTCFHKFIDINDVVECIKEGYDPQYMMLSTGISDNDFVKLQLNVSKLQENNIDLQFICIDVANGYMFKLVEFCQMVRMIYPNITPTKQ